MGIRLKRSAVAGKAPATTDLDLGELGVNTYDGKLFLKKAVSGVETIVEVGPVTSVVGRTGAVTLAKADVGLGSVDNTSDAAKPVSTATQTALNGKANSVHAHAIADVTNLQASLDGKAATSHTHTATQITDSTVAGRAILTAADAAAQRTALGLVVGTNVQGWDADIDAIASLAGTAGLLRKTAANTWALDSSTYLTSLGIGSLTQAWDADLDAIASLAGTSGFLKKTAANSWTLDTGSYLTAAVTSISFGTTGLTPATASTGAVTVAGTLAAANGGTGQSAYTIGDLLYASGVSSLAKLAAVATGNALISGGSGTAPSWGKIGLTTHVSGTLPIANGGTNASATPTNGGVSYGTGTAYAFTAAGTAGQALVSAGAAAPGWATLTLENLPGAWPKKSVKAATTANITLSGAQTIDGIALVAGDRVLVKNQATSSANGIYIVSATAWARSLDADTPDEIAGATVNVDQGATQAGSLWTTSFTPAGTLGTTAMAWYKLFDMSQTLPVANGGTGVASLTGLVKGSGTGAFSAAIAGTDYAAASHNHTTSQISDSTAAGRALLTAADAAAQLSSLVAAGTAISNTFTGSQTVNVADNANAALEIVQSGSADALNVSGVMVVAGGAAGQNLGGSGGTPRVQVHGVNSTYANSVFAAVNWGTSIRGGGVYCGTSRGGAVGAYAVSQADDYMGEMRFAGCDGAQMQQGATIGVRVDGTPAAGSMPGRIVFETSPTGAANPVERARIDSAGNLLVTGPGGLGYGAGSGGTVTQLTSRTTGVTLNKANGAITLVSAAGSANWQSFMVTNSTVAATDTIIVNQKSGTDLYEIHVTAVAAGSFRITFRTTGGTTLEQPVFSFAVIRAVTA